MSFPGNSGTPTKRTANARSRFGRRFPSSILRARRRGQAMIESVFVMVVLCLIFFTALEISRLFAGHEIINHAASTGVRARTVGFNNFMVNKVVRVATIPSAGPMEQPIVVRPLSPPETLRGTPVYVQWEASMRAQPSSPQLATERARIPLYLGGEDWGSLGAILDYEDWDTVYPAVEGRGGSGTTVSIRSRQAFPLKMPMGEFIHGLDEIQLSGRAWHADHASLYLE